MKRIRLAELAGVVSLASDLAEGRSLGQGLRAAVFAVRIAELLELDPVDRHEAFYVALLRDLGCTARARELQVVAEDDVAAQHRVASLDLRRPRGAMARVARQASTGRAASRTRATLRGLALGPRALDRAFRADAEAASTLSRRLGLRAGVSLALHHVNERWDGHGWPNGVTRDATPISARIARIAHVLAAPADDHAEDLVAPLRERAGKDHDPILVDLVDRRATTVLARRRDLGWDDMLGAEPSPRHTIPDEHLDATMRAVGDFADLKVPFLTGHSAAVGDLAAAAGQQLKLARTDLRALRHAGYVHDLGRVAVPLPVWTDTEDPGEAGWKRIRSHSEHSERLLARSVALAHLGAIVGRHHERLDGSGYHRGIPEEEQPLLGRVLAAADAYQAMTEPRPHRPALDPDDAAKELRREVSDGLLDRDSVTAVLAAAALRGPPAVRTSWPAGLTHREVQVLRLAAEGEGDERIAERLHIAPRTAASHLQTIGMKLGVTSRAAATLAAVEHGIVDRTRHAQPDPASRPKPRYQRRAGGHG